MCRNITALRGLEPAATPQEIDAAALQFVRKVAGISTVSAVTRGPVDAAVAEIAAVVTRLLDELPERKVPPKNDPPLRRPEVRARIAAREAAHAAAHAHGIPHDHDHDHDHDHGAHDDLAHDEPTHDEPAHDDTAHHHEVEPEAASA
ncbi:hypothetical protein CLV28_1615 [Sediminihabitans luteus]|uniref:DUF2277 family protein n=1 Tax=Sediminihabitans luteus TaxID=1138585 RepID=A0A2M9CQC5_9CELL|nr:DUF2277 domain-containing protein [Sediminihabitans luteus]PJJ74126.1 hypothetical protein CLV28_1615 [Sediminihabitans luteus]GII97958.1 hypothetical protein Slu03_03360 [Sediminihabitans luteus]